MPCKGWQKMTDLPPPPYGPEVDLSNLDYMPLYGGNLFASDAYTKSNNDEFAAAIKLWWEAWKQTPSASLPNDDMVLAALAGLGRGKHAVKAWLKIKAAALHGFELCSDGRLYHRFLGAEAFRIYEQKIEREAKKAQDRVRKNEYSSGITAEKKQNSKGKDENSDGIPEEFQNHSSGIPAEKALNVNVNVNNNNLDNSLNLFGKGGSGENPDKPLGDLSPEKPKPKTKTSADFEAELARDFTEFWEVFPRKVARGGAVQAYKKARLDASAGEILTACRVYATYAKGKPANEQRFIKHAATWLNQKCWLDEISLEENSHDGKSAATENAKEFEDLARQGIDPANFIHERGGGLGVPGGLNF